MPHRKDHKLGLLGEGQQGLLPASDERMFRENREFYEKHPTNTLELFPTGHTTQYGRKVYKDQFGKIHSESTTTIESPDGGWMNIPVIYGGRYVSPDRARDIIINNGMVDPETGEAVRSYESIPKAEEAARERMRTLNKPDQPWNKGEGLEGKREKGGGLLDFLISPAEGASLTNIDTIYNAIAESEHEGTSGSRWIKSDVKNSTAWGEVQINDGTMETARDTPGFLNPEEWQFANRFISIPADERKDWLIGPYEQGMYRTITKRLMQKYLDESGGDPLWVMLKWKMGPNATAKKGDSKASKKLEDLLKRMKREDPRYMRVYMQALGLAP